MQINLSERVLAPDYMVSFSPANQAEISDGLLKQILRKPSRRLHGEGFSPGRNSARAENPSPVFSNRANGLKNPSNRYHFFSPG